MKRFIVRLVIFLLIIFGLCWVPLIGAYDYEAALCIALVSILAVPMLAPKGTKSAASLWQALASVLIFWILANAVSGGVAWLRSELCDPLRGLEWQLLISLPACLLAALVWGWIARFTENRIIRCVVYILAVCLDFGFAGFALYNWPPLVAFGQFFGFFAGSIYDEAIDIFPALIKWRCGTLGLLLCLLWAQLPGAGLARKIAFPITGMLAAFGVHFWLSTSGQLVYMGRDAVSESLWATASSEDGAWRVHYLPASKNRADMVRENRRIFEEYSRDYQALESFFGNRPRQNIDIWLYPDAELKGRFLGARNTSFARVWKNEIHLVDAGPGSTLARHEMAHLFAGAFADGPFNVAGGLIPAMGWVEGLAMAAEWPVREFDLHTWSAAILDRSDIFPSMGARELIYAFWGAPSRMAYTLAGSWVRWLIDRYGIEKVKQLTAGSPGDFESITGTALDVAYEVWKSDLLRFYRNPKAVASVQLFFGADSIWTKHCARQRAVRNSEWYACLGDEFCDVRNLLDKGDFCFASQDIPEDAALSEANKLYDYYMARGPVDSISAEMLPNGEDTADGLRNLIVSMLDRAAQNPMPQGARLAWMERRADMLWHAHLNTAAWIMYNAMLKLPLPEAMMRRLEIKWQAAAWPESPVSSAVLRWFTSSGEREKMQIAAEFRHSPIIAYLDFVMAVYNRDEVRAKDAVYRILTHVAVSDYAERLTPRCWKELFRLVSYI